MFVKTILAIGLTISVEFFGMRAYNAVFNDFPTKAIPLSQRDDWQHELKLNPDLFISGRASWYDATKNTAWYTAQTPWGSPVKMYAAAGPQLRALVQKLFTKKINWGVELWRKMAARGTRPKFLVTSLVTGKSVVVTVTDWCSCLSGTIDDTSDDKIVDLSPDVFRALGIPLGWGIADIVMEPVR